MRLMKNVLMNIITGKDDFCCMCLKEITTNAICDMNEVVIDTTDEKVDLSAILSYLFKEDVLSDVLTYGKVCQSCKIAAVHSYTFMKTCENNFETLSKSVESVITSVNKMTEFTDLSCFKTMIITLDEDLSSEGYFYGDIFTLNMIRKHLKKILTLKAKSDLKPDKHVITCKGKSMNEYKKLLQLKKNTNAKRKKIIYDIPTVPDSELMIDNASYFRCKYCLKPFKERKSVRKHCFKFHYPRNFKCLKCEKCFLNKTTLKTHVKNFHKKMDCSECGRSFKNRHTLSKHKLNHDIEIVCQDCKRVYRSKDAFRKHLVEDICAQTTRKKPEQGEFVCHYCNKRYCTKAYLAKHIKHEHENARGFECEYCSKTFYTPSGLKVHTYKHTQEKNFECEQCKKRFVTKTSLVYHRRLHTGECPYRCLHCGRGFVSASRRIDHERRAHLPPQLQCGLCHKMFKGTGSLLKHKKRHTNPNSRLNYTIYKQRNIPDQSLQDTVLGL